jgi:hypothetical protein
MEYLGEHGLNIIVGGLSLEVGDKLSLILSSSNSSLVNIGNRL